VTPGQPTTVTETFSDNGVLPAQHVQLSLDAPQSWTVHATSATSFGAVESGQTVHATFQLTVPMPTAPFETDTVTAKASYEWSQGDAPLASTASKQVTLPTAVTAPYHTFSSTNPAATFGQARETLGIRAAGSDVFGSSN